MRRPTQQEIDAIKKMHAEKHDCMIEDLESRVDKHGAIHMRKRQNVAMPPEK